MNYEKVNDKKYSLRLNDVITDINVPYGKVEKLFTAFVGSGGVITADGTVQNDIISLITNFSTVGNILLSDYGPRGEVVKEGDCSQLSTVEIISLFEIATEVIEDFIKVITEMRKAQVMTEEAKPPQKKTKA